uniref:Secreted protein n=1 Tax=Anopheles coluzzii TaxID=1518534 RepID=A0A6E8W8P7_ANOCL
MSVRFECACAVSVCMCVCAWCVDGGSATVFWQRCKQRKQLEFGIFKIRANTDIIPWPACERLPASQACHRPGTSSKWIYGHTAIVSTVSSRITICAHEIKTKLLSP